MLLLNVSSVTHFEKIEGTLIYVVGNSLGKLSDNPWIKEATEYANFKCEAEKIFLCYNPNGFQAKQLIIVSVGDGGNRQNNENSGGTAIDKVSHGHKNPVSIVFDDNVNEENALSFLLGASLKLYSFDNYRTTLTDDDKPIEQDITVYTTSKNIEKKFEDNLNLVQGIFTARNLVSEPANILNPETYAARCLELERFGLKVSVLNEAQMAELGMFCLLGVGQGSITESKLVVIEWQGNKKSKDYPTALVGKGVCFDTGGISLKPPANMWDMVFDMGGSASVVGAMTTIALRKSKQNVVGIIGLVENMIDANAQRPGDVVKTANGKTVEVLNTDAEGRLVLADALWYVQDKFKPSTIIDLATLTGAIIMALGYDYTGLFSNNEKLAKKLVELGQQTGDKVWEMPLDASMKKRLKSRIADLANIASSPEGGSSVAASFLQEFINEDVAWVHLDIAGTAWTKEAKPTCPKGATGWGVRLLDAYVCSLEDNVD